jgi:hypothetical protein
VFFHRISRTHICVHNIEMHEGNQERVRRGEERKAEFDSGRAQSQRMGSDAETFWQVTLTLHCIPPPSGHSRGDG